ncbi:hypothetical protein D3C76_1196870 [compost metagenome]
MQETLDARRQLLWVLQQEGVGTLFDQADFHVRQQFAQGLGGLRRHQRIATGEQVQLRPGEVLQGRAGIQLRQHL